MKNVLIFLILILPILTYGQNVHTTQKDSSFVSFTGEIKMYGGTIPPNGWLLCDGSSLDTTTNNDLFQVIGYTYGGSGSNFNLPDARGRASIGAGAGPSLTSRSLGDTGGAETHTLTESEMPAHNHSMIAESGTGTSGNPNGRMIATPSGGILLYLTEDTGNVDRTLSNTTIDSTGANAAHENMMPFFVTNYIIKE